MEITAGPLPSASPTVCRSSGGNVRPLPIGRLLKRHAACGRARVQVAGAAGSIRQVALRSSTRMNRWAKSGGVGFECSRICNEKQLVRLTLEGRLVGSTSVQVHPDGTGAVKQTRPAGQREIPGRPGQPKVIGFAADARTALTLALSPGQAHDAPEGRRMLRHLQPARTGLPLLMNRAYEGDATRQLAREVGFTPVVPPQTPPSCSLGLRPAAVPKTS